MPLRYGDWSVYWLRKMSIRADIYWYFIIASLARGSIGEQWLPRWSLIAKIWQSRSCHQRCTLWRSWRITLGAKSTVRVIPPVSALPDIRLRSHYTVVVNSESLSSPVGCKVSIVWNMERLTALILVAEHAAIRCRRAEILLGPYIDPAPYFVKQMLGLERISASSARLRWWVGRWGLKNVIRLYDCLKLYHEDYAFSWPALIVLIFTLSVISRG
jgi:hypothetical protein